MNGCQYNVCWWSLFWRRAQKQFMPQRKIVEHWQFNLGWKYATTASVIERCWFRDGWWAMSKQNFLCQVKRSRWVVCFLDDTCYMCINFLYQLQLNRYLKWKMKIRVIWTYRAYNTLDISYTTASISCLWYLTNCLLTRLVWSSKLSLNREIFVLRCGSFFVFWRSFVIVETSVHVNVLLLC